ncbi:membrane protein insertion efficiency factor YidD [Candidatus Falkowbacteria bacterium RIFOXYD2_FULL_35_9]|uniref:Putative membrane protein insertion efficiency factor n=1 Tax=Candidatus Falkowbacteria bacterium RIFOXYC2_FULL_36_12 TaxID=1798002 RepID=A0A1F5T3Y4_9BACT|nr:MAG: membrane protein insertion efficiency factor YidD [Candidatus Falkowbacteria bacterium RIFOXYC2_FULL_36_12]OGF34810.1 MAG: membrane protein insertion efficiency factor YidD [Candidatus Falkowbacteria bacterium RIFOXYA2_FULL_35_8]OGF48415.1 MAG: membrane protein insertion efficiency factor YidD [Candidatus Falkowbacteria bacterium RIFOXYD2_FULL_35_9]
MKKLFRFIGNFPRNVVLKMIRFYQKTLSPDHGLLKYKHPFGCCKYFPTCSEYGYQAIEKYGLIKGGLKAGWRIIRCNPWSKGGIDKVD